MQHVSTLNLAPLKVFFSSKFLIVVHDFFVKISKRNPLFLGYCIFINNFLGSSLTPYLIPLPLPQVCICFTEPRTRQQKLFWKKTDLHDVERTDAIGQCPCVRFSVGNPSSLCPPSDEWSTSSTDWRCRKIRRPILEIRSPYLRSFEKNSFNRWFFRLKKNPK